MLKNTIYIAHPFQAEAVLTVTLSYSIHPKIIPMHPQIIIIYYYSMSAGNTFSKSTIIRQDIFYVFAYK